MWIVVILLVLVFMMSKRANAGGQSADVSLPWGGGPMSEQNVYNLARSVGFPPDMARVMVAIAIRESGLDPNARCLDCFPGIQEDSLGLWQINMHGTLGEARMRMFGLAYREELLNPAVNARAAFLTWGGSDNNLNVAWRINEEGAYQYRTKFLQALSSLPPVDVMEAGYGIA